MAQTNRRASQKSWYKNRGRVRMNIPCAGSGQVAKEVTEKGEFYFGGSQNKAIGDMPRGVCSECGDEIALIPKEDVPLEECVIRKHKDPDAPYRHQMLVTEVNYGRLLGLAERQGLEPDDFLNQLLEASLPGPSEKNQPKFI